jgi:FSR family fosmidomycin resistance protein-like MFS transporter
MTAATPSTFAHDSRVLGLISLGHLLSHFYQLCFAPLILVWHHSFGASFATLGAILTTFTLSMGAAQMPAGMLVDRHGARAVLVGGLILSGLAFAGMALAPNIAAIFALAALAGIGNAVFHPADYAILNSSLNPDHMGKAFSLHTFAGNLGGALAPATLAYLIALHDWRFAVVAVGLLGFIVAAVLLLQGGILKDEQDGATEETRKKAKTAFGWRENVAFMTSPPMVMLFLFFMTASMASGGIAAFSQVVNVKIQAIDIETAGTVLSAFLFAVTAGILAGGVAADKTRRHDVQAAIAFVGSAVIFALLALQVYSVAVLIGLFILAGFAQGFVRPARDMMVRALSPKGTTGRAFAFASTGMALGSASAPIAFGILLDMDSPHGVYWLVALFNLVAIATVMCTRFVKLPDINADAQTKPAQ